MRYAKVRYERDCEELAYRIYLTDSIYLKAENKAIATRYYDYLHRTTTDNRSVDEVAQDVLKRAGIEVITENG